MTKMTTGGQSHGIQSIGLHPFTRAGRNEEGQQRNTQSRAR